MAHFRNTFCDNSICVLSMKTMFCEQTLNAKCGILVQTHFAMIQSVAHFTNVQRFPRFDFMAISDFLIYFNIWEVAMLRIYLRDHYLVVVKWFVGLYEPIEVCRWESQ